MEEEITSIIQRKIWTIDDLLRETNELCPKAAQLPKEAKENIQVFSGEWTEESVRKHLERLKKAIEDPLRYKSRKLLEDQGVSIKSIPEEVFDDFIGIGKVVDLLKVLDEFSKRIAEILIKKGILLGWLKDGIDKAIVGLEDIIKAKTGFQRLFEEGVNESLRDELLRRSIENPGFISPAEDIILKMKYVAKFGTLKEKKEDFDEFKRNLIAVHQKLVNLQDEYSIPNEEISKSVRGKSLHEANMLLQDKLNKASEKRTKLLEERKMYSVPLQSIGHEVLEPPQGLYELEKEVEHLKRESLDSLGEEGLRLLNFLVGKEENFPDEISKEGIKRALEILRPLFVRSLREED